jgi:predicted glycosyltransferase
MEQRLSSSSMRRLVDGALQPSGKRFMIYSQDGLGLGHLRRTSCLAGEILSVQPDSCVLTVSDSPLGAFFEPRPNHDYVKLPSIVKAGPGDWHAVSLPIDFDEISSLRRELIRDVALRFRPHVLLVDHMPHGAMGELVPALDALVEQGRTRIVLGLRDVLDAPEVIRDRWRIEGAYEAIERYYDLILVYGSRELFDHAARYGHPPEISAKLRYCGYVCAPRRAHYARSVRREHKAKASAGKLLLGTAGGGADGYPMMRALLDAVPLLQDAGIPFRLVMVVGPFMPNEQRQDLQARAVGLPVRLRKSVSDLYSYVSAADAVVAMAGYNSTMEILRSGTPAVLVPRIGPSQEQRIRTELLRSRGWVESVDPTAPTPEEVAGAIARALRRSAPDLDAGGPDLHGLTVAVRHLLSLLPPSASDPSLTSTAS